MQGFSIPPSHLLGQKSIHAQDQIPGTCPSVILFFPTFIWRPSEFSQSLTAVRTSGSAPCVGLNHDRARLQESLRRIPQSPAIRRSLGHAGLDGLSFHGHRIFRRDCNRPWNFYPLRIVGVPDRDVRCDCESSLEERIHGAGWSRISTRPDRDCFRPDRLRGRAVRIQSRKGIGPLRKLSKESLAPRGCGATVPPWRSVYLFPAASSFFSMAGISGFAMKFFHTSPVR
jgi:hypothetical protein